jgi:hypothetical protein
VSRFIRTNATLEQAVEAYLALYRSVLDEQPVTGEACNWYAESRPLQLEDQAALHLRFATVPDRVAPGQHFIAHVSLDNRSAVPIATAAPWPCLLMYRWLDRWTGAMIVEHGHRSILQPPAPPHTESDYPLRVIAPDTPGDYVLRATVVQEGWRWLDALAPPVQAEASVRVSADDCDVQGVNRPG